MVLMTDKPSYPWPQHDTEPRFAHTPPKGDAANHTFILSNEMDGEERKKRYKVAKRWARKEFGPIRKGVWSTFDMALMIRIDRLDLATHFRLRWC